MTAIRLHHVAQARSFRILWLLHEMGTPPEVARHSMFDGSMRRPDYLALSPAGRVPALEIDGRVIFESGAITEYLCESRAPALGRAPGDPERVDWLEWLHFAETIGQHVANLTQQHIVLREDHMRSAVVMKLEARRLEKTLEVVDRVVTGRDWLLPSGFSAVDVAVGYGALHGRRFVRLDALPGLAAWLARIEARPAYRAALAADGPAEVYLRDFYEAPRG
ncbi:glutathione S-transferase family protein [Amaricoccus sp.]|uniref:glutathione S-transferase family protein n=1 Tax=Amaricoccus sp. TaxID=1872485 RepID=UPI001B58DE16|nr:glutathione S-transferase [Amaricoccus sp.]MBP7000999.1 glutathione S-transferase [Amaricoccus sp.]